MPNWLQCLGHYLRAGDWINQDRILAWARVVLVFELVGFAFCIAGTHGLIVPLQHPVASDYVSFYSAGRLADQGAASLVYSQPDHFAISLR